ncbi:hypothetical protein KDM87_05005 [Undibacterium sp. FT147W]|uniref:DUF1090 family protein n=1 Tax=Undibacterium rivi TaxID=2828729 RepID=A0ABS5GZQ6_9BURK|nr:hypothetical protein [Undibacterium rivi]MBR7791948.1 hypothetical protein [Undibacterium rivi]
MNKALAIFFATLLVLMSIGSVVAIPSPGSGVANPTSGFAAGKHTQASVADVSLSATTDKHKNCGHKKVSATSSCESPLADVKKNKLSVDERKVLRSQIRDVEQEFDAAK